MQQSNKPLPSAVDFVKIDEFQGEKMIIFDLTTNSHDNGARLPKKDFDKTFADYPDDFSSDGELFSSCIQWLLDTFYFSHFIML